MQWWWVGLPPHLPRGTFLLKYAPIPRPLSSVKVGWLCEHVIHAEHFHPGATVPLLGTHLLDEVLHALAPLVRFSDTVLRVDVHVGIVLGASQDNSRLVHNHVVRDHGLKVWQTDVCEQQASQVSSAVVVVKTCPGILDGAVPVLLPLDHGFQVAADDGIVISEHILALLQNLFRRLIAAGGQA